MEIVKIICAIVLPPLGVFMVIGKDISFSVNMYNPTERTEVVEAFVFGVAYFIGALGCLFPLFLVVVTQAMVAPTVWLGVS